MIISTHPEIDRVESDNKNLEETNMIKEKVINDI